MSPKREQKYQKAYAHELLRIALQDYASSLVLANHHATRVENVFLLAQQALEKALKAVICWSELSVPFTHDIAVLIERLSSVIVVPFTGKFDALSEYATIRRYMEGSEVMEEEDVKEILQELKAALDWCEQQIV